MLTPLHHPKREKSRQAVNTPLQVKWCGMVGLSYICAQSKPVLADEARSLNSGAKP